MKNQDSTPTTPTKKGTISFLGASPKLKVIKSEESTEPKKVLPKINLTGGSSKFAGRNPSATIENKKPVATIDDLEELKASILKLHTEQSEQIKELDDEIAQQKAENEKLRIKLAEQEGQNKESQEELVNRISNSKHELENKLNEQIKELSEAQAMQIEELQNQLHGQDAQTEKSLQEVDEKINATQQMLETQLYPIKEALNVTASYALKVNMEQCDVTKVLVAIEKKLNDEEFTVEDEDKYLAITQQEALKEAVQIFKDYSALSSTLEDIEANIFQENGLNILNGNGQEEEIAENNGEEYELAGALTYSDDDNS